jgi:hypothetical protein
MAIRNTTPLHAGVNMLPQAFALIPASIIVGGVITRLNHFRWAIWSGWLLVTISTGLVVLWGPDTSCAIWVPIMIVVGIGHGLILNAQNFATQAIAQPRDEANAAAMYAFLRSLGSALGVGIGGSVFQNIMVLRLNHYGLPIEIARNAEGYIHELWSMPTNSVLHQHVVDAYVYGIRGTFGLFCGMAGLAGLASLLIKHFDMNKELESDHKLGQIRGTKAFKQNSATGEA